MKTNATRDHTLAAPSSQSPRDLKWPFFGRLIATAVIISSTFTYAAVALAETDWSKGNDPASFADSPDGKYEFRYRLLPQKGAADIEYRGWSDSYWPLEKGMIANRWQVPKSDFKKDRSPTRFEAFQMLETDLTLLSPSEKYDLARGDYEYTLTAAIRKKLSGREKEWRGLCDGWSHASLNLDEPQPFVFENPDGLRIPFTSSDVKALLAYYYAKVDDSPAKQVGQRCFVGGSLAWTSNNCKDIDAGAFHVILANEMGIRHKGFIGDRDPLKEVWNQPFVAFDSKEVTRLKVRKEKIYEQILIAAEVTFVDEISVPDALPVIGRLNTDGTPANPTKALKLNYSLDLDYSGRIIGGEWMDSESPHPDFIWKKEFNRPSGEHELISKIYDLSVISNRRR